MNLHRDNDLAREAREVIAEQEMLRQAALTLEVRGGVVHARGEVPSVQALERLRRVVSRLRGVLALWDLVRVDGQAPLRVLDVGCGGTKQCADAIGIDREAYPGVDLIADLERPLPVAGASVDHIFAVHFLEHVHNLLPLLNELHRALKPHGVLHVMVPHQGYVNAWADPTHVRYFHPQTFKFFCRPYPGRQSFYPWNVSSTIDNICADLQPVGPARPQASEEELARFFD